jgi:hypothetical protein
VDIVLSTHAHFDHDAVDGLMVLERLVGQYKLGDIEITGLADKHQCQSPPDQSADPASVQACPPNNVIGLDNAIQIIATGGLRIAIWGDNRAVPISRSLFERCGCTHAAGRYGTDAPRGRCNHTEI